MAVKVADLESELIDAVCQRVREQLPDGQAAVVETFVRQYYHWVPRADLAGRTKGDLYGAAIAHWRLARVRAPGEDKVHVYNPDPEDDGWSSPHTVIEVVSDDMPFIVDSVTMALARETSGIDLVIHPVMIVRRDGEGLLTEVLEQDADADGAIAESVLHAEVGREPDRERLEAVRERVEQVLREVRVAVEGWPAMRGQMLELADELEREPPPIDAGELAEVTAFLRWLADDHFTFLGYREYDVADDGGAVGLQARAESGQGILRGPPRSPYNRLSPKASAQARRPEPLTLTKTNSRATVHRPSYLDYVGVKKFGPGGSVVGERMFLGLYTSTTYRANPFEIPLLRGKVKGVVDRAGFLPTSHDAKALVEILESYPRDALLQIGADDLFAVAMGLLGLGERQRVRLFVWQDPLDRFVSCLVTIPRDRFNTENRERVGRILLQEFGGRQLDWTLQLTDSLLVRVHYIVHCTGGVTQSYDVAAIERRLVEATRAWTDELRAALIEAHGEAQGLRLYRRYERAFPPSYRSDWEASSAVEDIHRIERLDGSKGAVIGLYDVGEGRGAVIHTKLYSSAGVSLSDVVPTFEHMGARVVDERPYPVVPGDRDPVWIYDFGLRGDAEDLENVRDLFEEVFVGARNGALEDDGLNGLVLRAALTAREIVVVRAVARYLRQAGIGYSDAYMERTLLGHPDIARLLVKLFVARFDPESPDPRLAKRLGRAMEVAIDGVPSLDEDRILRNFLTVVRAMQRTNYFRRDERGEPLSYLSFKLDAEQISILPKPRPRFEIFVYSPRFEGVHLRGGRVARGGIRWSDRPEDFRTEILGLLKAQMVKNALIVPVGAKGGFVLKRTAGRSSDELREEAVACYRKFLCGLLDLTDNIVDGEVVAPRDVVRYDDDDPYLVVAADKGTATFSDLANEVSAQYGFWLGDAFASGGSHGYDHKQMGITARGAWESVRRHFRELGTDTQSTDFTVIGIGDMSGDVFGNGMLLSPHIRLVGAFDHRHVFLDPDPDAKASFAERRRLFEQPQSSWDDYDRELISSGGGVYERTAKSVEISPQVKEALAIDSARLSPAELIKALLRAPVDLLWNGGIGTYVKASDESQADTGDKANDAVRVNGSELRCRVVGEGGNLGFTQRGRIEYALAGGPEQRGGAINTDAIDNVAGVNTSDHEVNIKILLDAEVAAGRLEQDARNDLLVEMTDAVAERVLHASYVQTQAISLALAQAAPMIDVHARLIRRLEQVSGLDRELVFLPSEEALSERKSAHRGLVAPELATVMAYAKIYLYTRLLDSDVPEDEYLAHDLERYFPAPLPERYAEQMRGHRLRREIVATVVANQLVDRAGTTFVYRLGEETGADPPAIARGYAVAREVFEMRAFGEAVEALDNRVDASVQLEMLIEARRLVERATRSLVRADSGSIQIEKAVRRFHPGAQLLSAALPDVLDGAESDDYAARAAQLLDAGVPTELATRVAAMPSLPAVFDIVAVASATRRQLADVMATYFRIGSRLELNWLRERILELPRANRWQALARSALRDDINGIQRELTREVLQTGGKGASGERAIERWEGDKPAAVERYLGTLAEIRASRTYDTTTLPVALREVRRLLHGAASDQPEVS